MHTRHDAIVVGAGQAGLAASWWLTRAAWATSCSTGAGWRDRWRTQRWDTFRLLSRTGRPACPGTRYSGRDPDGFMTGAEVADVPARLRAVVRRAGAQGVTVQRVAPPDDGWLVTTSAGSMARRRRRRRHRRPRGSERSRATADLPVPCAAHERVPQRGCSYRPGAVLVVGRDRRGSRSPPSWPRRGGGCISPSDGTRCAAAPLPRPRHLLVDGPARHARPHGVSLAEGARRRPNAVLAGGTRDLDVRRLAQGASSRTAGCSGWTAAAPPSPTTWPRR